MRGARAGGAGSEARRQGGGEGCLERPGLDMHKEEAEGT